MRQNRPELDAEPPTIVPTRHFTASARSGPPYIPVSGAGEPTGPLWEPPMPRLPGVGERGTLSWRRGSKERERPASPSTTAEAASAGAGETWHC